MAIIEDNDQFQIIETVTANGRTLQTVWKPGSVGANAAAIQQKAQQAIQTNVDALALPDPTAANNTYLGHAAIPAGTLTTAQLSTIVRTLSDQLDATTRQNNALVSQVQALTRQNTALIRLAVGVLDATTGT